MYENLLKAVTNLGSPRVLLVGDFMLDAYTYGDAERISPEAPVPVLNVTHTDYSCGGAGCVAANLAALGAKPICIGIVGDDQNADLLKQLLAEKNADVSGLITIPGRPTTTKQRLVGLAQHRHQQQLFRMDTESTERLTTQQYDKIIQAFTEKLPAADIVCLQDYNKGMLAPLVCTQMIKSAVKAAKKVLIDPSPISDYSKYAGATLITPNRQETSLAVGFDIKTTQDAADAARKLIDSLNLKAAVITLDKQGAFLKSEKYDELVPTRPRNVYDVTGAGDTVLATLAVTLAAGCDYKTAVRLSNIAGGIEVEKFGAVPVAIEEIINEIIALNRGSTGKLRQLDSLLTELSWRRKQNETVVWTNGCFDVIHIGHIEFLKFCKQQGGIVVVGLNSDSSVKTIKGPDRPIHNQLDRAAVLAALESVDYITIFDQPDPLNLIKMVKPDVLVKGRDWAEKGVVGKEFVESYGGKNVLAPLVEGKSSTSTIEKIKAIASKSKKDKSPTK